MLYRTLLREGGISCQVPIALSRLLDDMGQRNCVCAGCLLRHPLCLCACPRVRYYMQNSHLGREVDRPTGLDAGVSTNLWRVRISLREKLEIEFKNKIRISFFLTVDFEMKF